MAKLIERQNHFHRDRTLQQDVPWIQKPHAKEKPLPFLDLNDNKPSPAPHPLRSMPQGPRQSATVNRTKRRGDALTSVDLRRHHSTMLPPLPCYTTPTSPVSLSSSATIQKPTGVHECICLQCSRQTKSMYAKRRSLPVCTAKLASLDRLQRALTIGTVPAYEVRHSASQFGITAAHCSQSRPVPTAASPPSPLYRLNAYTALDVTLPETRPGGIEGGFTTPPVTSDEKKEQLLNDDGTGNHRHDHHPLTFYHTMKMRDRADRVDAYNKAYEDCIRATSGLGPWTQKQYNRDQPYIMSVCAPRPALPRESSICSILLPILGKKRNSIRVQRCVVEWPDYLAGPAVQKDTNNRTDSPEEAVSEKIQQILYQKPNSKYDDDNDTMKPGSQWVSRRLSLAHNAMGQVPLSLVRRRLMARPKSCSQPSHNYHVKQNPPLRAQSTSAISTKSLHTLGAERWAQAH